MAYQGKKYEKYEKMNEERRGEERFSSASAWKNSARVWTEPPTDLAPEDTDIGISKCFCCLHTAHSHTHARRHIYACTCMHNNTCTLMHALSFFVACSDLVLAHKLGPSLYRPARSCSLCFPGFALLLSSSCIS